MDVISTISHLVEDALEEHLVDRDGLLFNLFVSKRENIKRKMAWLVVGRKWSRRTWIFSKPLF